MLIYLTALRDRRLRTEAAAEVTSRIRAGAERAPQTLRDVLAYVERHLFSPTLTATCVKAEVFAGAASGLDPLFQKVFGETLAGFVRGCRLRVAEELLRRTSLSISRIARLVGYSSYEGFRKSFHRCRGMTPRQWRQSLVEPPPPMNPREVERADAWRRALAGAAGPELFADIQRQLAAAHPLFWGPWDHLVESDENVDRDNHPTVPRVAYEAFKAERIAERIESPHLDNDTKERLLAGVVFRSPALHELWLEKAETTRESDPERSVELSRLAVRSLEDCGPELDDGELRCRKTLALARLARACFRADLDAEAAEAVGLAETAWASLGDREVRVETELLEARALWLEMELKQTRARVAVLTA
jgi:AraC-like DNA-binding protein